MKKKAKRRVFVPSTDLLASVDSVLQWLREKARNEDRRSDAQHYADTQWLIRHDMKANAPAHAGAVATSVQPIVRCRDCGCTDPQEIRKDGLCGACYQERLPREH